MKSTAKKSTAKLTTLTTILGTFMIAGTAQAATVLIDWSASNDFASLAGSPDSNTNYWNSLGPGGVGNNGDFTATALVDTDNGASGWSVAADLTGVTSNFTGAGFGGAGIDGSTGADPFNITGSNRPTVDGMYANYNTNGTAIITFTGLAANTQYDLSAIGGRASGSSNGYIKVLAGAAGAGAADIDLVDSDDFLDTFSLLGDGTILDFSVTSNGAGVIEFEFFEGQNDDDGGTSATWNALSITEVPEPATALLGGLGLLLLLRRRR